LQDAATPVDDPTDTNWALRDRDSASSYAFFTHRLQLTWEEGFHHMRLRQQKQA